MLNYDHVFSLTYQSSDDSSCDDTLANVQISGCLVEHVGLDITGGCDSNCESLKFSPAQYGQVSIEEMAKFQCLDQFLRSVLTLEQFTHLSLHCLSDRIHVLRLH